MGGPGSGRRPGYGSGKGYITVNVDGKKTSMNLKAPARAKLHSRVMKGKSIKATTKYKKLQTKYKSGNYPWR